MCFRSQPCRLEPLLFENVEFVLPNDDDPQEYSPATNRKTTIVQLSPPSLRHSPTLFSLQDHCGLYEASGNAHLSLADTPEIGEWIENGGDEADCNECTGPARRTSLASRRAIVCEVRQPRVRAGGASNPVNREQCYSDNLGSKGERKVGTRR